MTGATERNDPRDQDTAARLGERLHERARRLELTAEPPVAAVLRLGRRERRRRRAVISAAAVTALVLPLGAAGLGLLPGDAPSAADSAGPALTVRPGERLGIGHGIQLALLGPGEVAVGTAGTIDAAMESAGPHELERAGLAAYTLPAAVETAGGDTVHAGTWRAAEPPTALTIRTDHGELAATLVTLPGSPTWGAWFVVVPGEEEPIRGATLKAPDGHSLYSTDFATPEPADPPAP
ncbi:hypothetical protein [Streptomyces sp. MP131-18]|uniref:hypothetical protein n=1 Tax=Streptomyces sp. MP131-18 TaxID=1857892 RepID=UPI00097BCE4C|nr:hypothetical protein [Streptomyces sp. MP131-18]ONK14065.1 hypothetical protein STBA_48440 [Streptomyces sp. MP131-18]